MSTDPVPTRRSGAETRRQAQRVALELFTRQGYEATSLREIADALGINKASLYYHFPNKAAIVRSLVEDRGAEAAALADEITTRPATPGLIEEAVNRWVTSFTAEKLAGIRFLRANPRIARLLDDGEGETIAAPLTRIADHLARAVPTSAQGAALIRMALLSINSAVEAAADTELGDEEIIHAARAAARALAAAALAG